MTESSCALIKHDLDNTSTLKLTKEYICNSQISKGHKFNFGSYEKLFLYQLFIL